MQPLLRQVYRGPALGVVRRESGTVTQNGNSQQVFRPEATRYMGSCMYVGLYPNAWLDERRRMQVYIR